MHRLQSRRIIILGKAVGHRNGTLRRVKILSERPAETRRCRVGHRDRRERIVKEVQVVPDLVSRDRELRQQAVEFVQERRLIDRGTAKAAHLEHGDGHRHLRRELKATSGVLRVGSPGCLIEGVHLVGDVRSVAEQIASQTQGEEQVHFQRHRQAAGKDIVNRVVDAPRVLIDQRLHVGRELGEHIVQLGRGVAFAPRRNVVIPRCQYQSAERLEKCTPSHSADENELAQPVLGRLPAVFAGKLQVGVGVDMRQVEGLLADRHRPGSGNRNRDLSTAADNYQRRQRQQAQQRKSHVS